MKICTFLHHSKFVSPHNLTSVVSLAGGLGISKRRYNSSFMTLVMWPLASRNFRETLLWRPGSMLDCGPHAWSNCLQTIGSSRTPKSSKMALLMLSCPGWMELVDGFLPRRKDRMIPANLRCQVKFQLFRITNLKPLNLQIKIQNNKWKDTSYISQVPNLNILPLSAMRKCHILSNCNC